MTEVFVGAGANATLVPEMDIQLNNVSFQDNVGTLSGDNSSGDQALIRLVPDLYIGCRVTVLSNGSTTETETIIKSNTATTFTVESSGISGQVTTDVNIHAFGSPVPGPRVSNSTTPTLLSDNWLGLVETFTPPNVEVELKQLNLAVSGSRNYGYQFKGAETVSGGSLDLSVNNGSWLYYALGKGVFAIPNNLLDGTSNGATGSWGGTTDAFLLDATNERIIRSIDGNEYPLKRHTDNDVLEHGDGGYVTQGAAQIDYTFSELNGDSLPSFALEVTYDKSNVAVGDVVDSNTHHSNRYCRIFTGCQVNNLTLNFEEGMELKANIDMVTRSAFDAPSGYLPRRGVAAGASALENFSTTKANNYPFMFSDGSIKLFGQNVTRVKSGSLAIANNIAPQRFIGNTNRKVMSAHIPGQRTYELTLTMLVTDTQLWDELRSQEEYDTDTGLIELNFTKENGEVIEIKLDDYIITNVTVPFPEDKGPVEVEATIQARTLSSCTYSNAFWAIMM